MILKFNLKSFYDGISAILYCAGGFFLAVDAGLIWKQQPWEAITECSLTVLVFWYAAWRIS